MIDRYRPAYDDTPASAERPVYTYRPRTQGAPFVSIITAYYNAGPVFQETISAIQRMTFANWEWLIVDDGSTEAASLAQLESLAAQEPRARIIRQANAGPGAARNRAAREARGRYLFQLDADDLIEPTFIEQAVWWLETQPQFAACNSWNVTFGSQTLLWAHGFEEGNRNLLENWVTNQAVIRREAFLAMGGYDEAIVRGHEDWDLWLSLAEAGHWGYTIPDYLTWYRRHDDGSRLAETEGDLRRARTFRAWLRRKHAGLARRFPQPRPSDALDVPALPLAATVENALAKPDGCTRVLLVVPWFQIGGADKFNLDLIQTLSARGYQFTVVSTVHAEHPWLHEVTTLTPDVFILDHCVRYGDYPRFLSYLVESRQIDAVLISNSEVGYRLLPYLRLRHPHLAILDYTHLEEPDRPDGGYPGISVSSGAALDLRVTCTEHLRAWMVARGAPADRVVACHANIASAAWDATAFDVGSIRAGLGVAEDTALLLFVGRVVAQKRPLLLAEIMRRLPRDQLPPLLLLVVGAGDELPALRRLVKQYDIQHYVRLLGAQPNARVRELLAASDLLLLPSASEGLALVLYEAMAMGTVPVAAAVGGHAELVTPECGALIAPGPDETDEIERYVAALTRLLRQPAERRAMAQRCRTRVVERFDLRLMGDGMEQALTLARASAAVRSTVPASEAEVAGILHATRAALLAYREAELAEVAWAARMSTTWGTRLRRAREWLVPMGSARYRTYARLRQEARFIVRSTQRAARRVYGNLRGRLPGRRGEAPAATLTTTFW